MRLDEIQWGGFTIDNPNTYHLYAQNLRFTRTAGLYVLRKHHDKLYVWTAHVWREQCDIMVQALIYAWLEDGTIAVVTPEVTATPEITPPQGDASVVRGRYAPEV
jgi:hypothetical protein